MHAASEVKGPIAADVASLELAGAVPRAKYLALMVGFQNVRMYPLVI